MSNKCTMVQCQRDALSGGELKIGGAVFPLCWEHYFYTVIMDVVSANATAAAYSRILDARAVGLGFTDHTALMMYCMHHGYDNNG